MALIGVRKLMDYFYTQQDLSWLDHLLPEDDRRKAEDEGHKLETGVQLVAPQKRPVTVSITFTSSQLNNYSCPVSRIYTVVNPFTPSVAIWVQL